jgi:hypothetical protein
MFWKKRSQTNTPVQADEPPDFMLEAEQILLRPDMLSMAAGIEPTPRPLRAMLSSGDDAEFDTAINSLFVLLHGPNGRYRKIAAFAFGQLGFNPPPLTDILRDRCAADPASDVQRALSAALMVLQSASDRSETSQIARRRQMWNFYGGR